MSDCHDVNVKCRVKACMCCVGMFNIQALRDGFPKCCMLYFKCHPCVLDCKCCLFQRAASPSLLGRMVESAMPLLGVENEGKVNACPKLIAATGYTYVPTATPVCESPAGANDNPAQPSAQKHKTLTWDLNFLRCKQPQSTPPWGGPRHQRVCTLCLRSFHLEDRPS